MKYEPPELSQLSPAIYAIQGGSVAKPFGHQIEGITDNELIAAYEDWE